LFYITAEEIQNSMTHLDDLWEGVLTVPGTQRMHSVLSVTEFVIKHSDVASTNDSDYVLFAFKPSVQIPVPSVVQADKPSGSSEKVTTNAQQADEAGPSQQQVSAKKGDYAAVVYGESWLPGKVTKVDGEFVEMKFMHSVGLGRFKWLNETMWTD
jgi:hypothetical protein